MPQPWSFSALDAYLTCARKYHAEKVARIVKEVKSASADYGSEAHKHFENYLFKDTPLPLDLRHHEAMLVKVKAAPGTGYQEQKLALNADYKPTGFFDSDVWVRCIIDYAKVNDDNALVVDWKFGKMKDDNRQIRLASAVLMHTMPEVNTVVGCYYWAKDKKWTKSRVYRTDLGTIWNDFLPDLRRLDLSFKDNSWPARPSGLCRRYCQVTACEHCGK